MPAYTVKKFGGSMPRVAEHLLSDDNASEARDCRLWHGRLEAWRNPLKLRDYSPGPTAFNTVLYWECCWYEYTTCVDIAYGPVTCKRLFMTGDQPWPSVVETDPATCIKTTRRLGLPCGAAPPSVALGALGTSAPKDTESRSYAYQYVNTAGERGELSQVSEPTLIRDGQTVVVSGWAVPDTSWSIASVLIYRTVKGYQQVGKDKGNVLSTTWMQVGSAAIGAGSFTDSMMNELLVSALEEDIAGPPPAGMNGIVYLASSNTLAGFMGRRVYFSENNSYHQWPYYVDLDDDVCGLCESHNVLYVATNGAPYVIVGPVEGKEANFREVIRLPGDHPMVGCGNRRMCATPFGAVYPSHDGMIALNGLTALSQRVTATESNSVSILTYGIYAPDDWQKLYPESATPAVFGGQLFVFLKNGAFVMSLPSTAKEGWTLNNHTTLSDTGVINAFVTRMGEFLIVKPDGVYQWDRGATLRPYRWVSPESVSPVPINFGAANLFFEGGSVEVTINNEAQTFERTVLSSRQFRLPKHMQGDRWKVTLEGTGAVRLFSMATSMQELGA